MSNPERKTNAQLVDTINQLKASLATPDLQFGEMWPCAFQRVARTGHNPT